MLHVVAVELHLDRPEILPSPWNRFERRLEKPASLSTAEAWYRGEDGELVHAHDVLLVLHTRIDDLQDQGSPDGDQHRRHEAQGDDEGPRKPDRRRGRLGTIGQQDRRIPVAYRLQIGEALAE